MARCCGTVRSSIWCAARAAQCAASRSVLGKTDASRFSDTLNACGDVDAVAHQVAIALLDHVAQVNADTELNAALCRKASVALDHAVLHFDGAADGIDHAAKLNDASVASALDDATVMHGDGRIDQIAAQRSQPASLLYPATSAARMAASFRVSAMAVPSPQARLAWCVGLDRLFRLADHCSRARD
jgi:hypothetical protein